MKRMGAVSVFFILLAIACSSTDTPRITNPTALEATVQALASENNATTPPNSGIDVDIESTITYRVQGTVQALFNATPIPSPTPTIGTPQTTSTPEPTSFTIQTGGSFNTAPAPTPTRISPVPTTQVTTPAPTRPLDCVSASDGVRVSAWINGNLVASTSVDSGLYTLLVEQPTDEIFFDETITFTLGNSEALQTITWKQGAASKLDLTAQLDGISRFAPNQLKARSLSGGPLAQPLPPHVILGTARIGDC